MTARQDFRLASALLQTRGDGAGIEETMLLPPLARAVPSADYLGVEGQGPPVRAFILENTLSLYLPLCLHALPIDGLFLLSSRFLLIRPKSFLHLKRCCIL